MRMRTRAKVWFGLLVGGGAVVAAMVAYMLRQPYDHRIPSSPIALVVACVCGAYFP
jgi:hypothetical protein